MTKLSIIYILNICEKKYKINIELKEEFKMKQKLNIAVIGCGPFAYKFINLFKSHPYTEKIYVCDLIEENAKAFAKQFDVEIISTFEDALNNADVNCIAVFTPRHLHGDISIRSLKAGKHVYSAVPMASSVEECQEIVKLVSQTKLTYMMGETCYYFPCALFAREIYQQGRFGEFSYGASQYYHHINDISYGERPAERGMPPLFYSTHSTSMLLSAVNSYATKVTCFGCKDRSGDPAFTKGGNVWGNEHINQYVMMQLANGGTARITEARGFGHGSPSSYISAIYGTKASYEYSNAQHILCEKDLNHDVKSVVLTENGNYLVREKEEKIKLTDYSDYVNTEEMVQNKHLPNFKEQVANGNWKRSSLAAVQKKEAQRLPKEFDGLENDHMATHKFLIDDFCKAAYNGTIPPMNAWFSARVNIPGLVALESAKQGGIPLDVPDCGDAPIE